MHTTRTDRENRVERAIKNFEERKRRFFRMDGSKLFGEAEHAERMERLVSELREEVQEEIEGAEADAAQPSLGYDGLLSRAGGETHMATKAGVGMSRHYNPNVAGREAAEQALEKAGVDRPDFVVMFGSIGYDQRSLVQAVCESTGGAPLTGCSVEGTINGDDADESNFSVVVTAISSEELR